MKGKSCVEGEPTLTRNALCFLAQANLATADSDVEMKRMRESEDDSEVSKLPNMQDHALMASMAED